MQTQKDDENKEAKKEGLAWSLRSLELDGSKLTFLTPAQLAPIDRLTAAMEGSGRAAQQHPPDRACPLRHIPSPPLLCTGLPAECGKFAAVVEIRSTHRAKRKIETESLTFLDLVCTDISQKHLPV